MPIKRSTLVRRITELLVADASGAKAFQYWEANTKQDSALTADLIWEEAEEEYAQATKKSD